MIKICINVQTSHVKKEGEKLSLDTPRNGKSKIQPCSLLYTIFVFLSKNCIFGSVWK
ncbi:hypothetical protein V6Z11_A07G131900 [Gossypium hirsutum]